jgi:superfamily I DNA and/or RNA helicase
LIGDQKQLPAVVLQSREEAEVTDETLREAGICNLRDSLFERLYRTAPPTATDMLCKQGRMHPEVARFANEAFYGGKLESLGLEHQRESLLLTRHCDELIPEYMNRRVTFIPSQEELEESSFKVNRSEAQIVAQLAEQVYRRYESGFDPNRTLGIITPYRSQISLIKQALADRRIPLLERVLVDTVERFQGSEREVIIYSFCVNRLHQLQTLPNVLEENGLIVDRKLNVVLTRARRQLFLTGVPHLLRHNPIYAALMEFCEKL